MNATPRNHSVMGPAIEWVLRRRWLVIAFVLALSALAGVFASRVSFESSIDIWFLRNDPDLEVYREFVDRFGTDDALVLGVFADDVFAPEVLRATARLTAGVETLKDVRRVRSLANVQVLGSTSEGVALRPLVEELPENAAEADLIRARALDHPLLRGLLVTADANASAIVAELAPIDDVARKVSLVRRVRDLARTVQADADLRVAVGGTPVVDYALFARSRRDFAVLTPAAALVVLLMAAVVFRSVSAALATLSVVTLASLWTLGLMGAFGMHLNVVSAMLTSVILAVGVADGIHVTSEYAAQLHDGESRTGALARAVRRVLLPCFFTTGTTVIAFLSFLPSELRPLRDFGWLTAVGVGFALLLSLTWLPALLSLLPAPAAPGRGTGRLLRALGHPSTPRNRAVLAVTGLALLFAMAGLPKLHVGINLMNYFNEDDPLRRDVLAIDRELGGSATLNAYVRTDSEGLQNPDVLRRLDELERWLGTLPGSGEAMSIVDLVREADRILRPDAPDAGEIPDTPAAVAQYLLVLERSDVLDAVSTPDRSHGRVALRFRLPASDRLAEQLPDIEQYLAEHFHDDELRVDLTGYVKLTANMERYLIRSQIESFLIAFAAVTTMMVILFRSVRLGLFSMLPNLLPIALGLGLMAWAGIDLDPGTVMVAAVALGLVVDDTVHFLFRIRENVAAGVDLEGSVDRAVHEVGRPILVTSLLLVAAFSTMLLATFAPIGSFGLLTATIVVLAVVADLVVLPAALLTIRPSLR